HSPRQDARQVRLNLVDTGTGYFCRCGAWRKSPPPACYGRRRASSQGQLSSGPELATPVCRQTAHALARLVASRGTVLGSLPARTQRAPQKVENQLAARGRGVDALLQALEPDPQLVQFCGGDNQVLQGAAELIQPPGNQRVAGSQVLQRCLQARSLRFSAARFICKGFLATGMLERIGLEVERLVLRGDASVANQHACPMLAMYQNPYVQAS